MKSKRSFFEPGIFRNLLQRFWPLWAGYLLLMLFYLPVSLGSADFTDTELYTRCGADGTILRYAITFTPLAFLAGGISAMAVFSHLYQSRSAGMMASLPVKREGLFLTAYLAGLLPLLAANVIAAVMAMLLGLGNSYIHAAALLEWLAMVSLNLISFYSFAVFCAMLTGNILVMLPVYAVLELTAFAVQSALTYLTQLLSYGYAFDSSTPSFLSPLAVLYHGLRIRSDYSWLPDSTGLTDNMMHVETAVSLEGWGLAIGYCLAGIVLAAAALMLYRRRSMESAGDTVAIPVLKPAFRYCLSLGCALVLPLAAYSVFFIRQPSGPQTALLITASGIICAIFGWYAAEMIIQRSFRVFSLKPFGLILVCGFYLFLCLGTEFDLFRIERKVPEASQVESVNINASFGYHGKTTFRDSEYVEAVCSLHEELIDAKSHEDNDEGSRIVLEYYMKDGSKLSRIYKIRDMDLLTKTADLLNTPASILSKFPSEDWIVPENLAECEISYCLLDLESGRQDYRGLRLDPKTSWGLYEACLADAADGNINRVSPEGSNFDSANIDVYFYFRHKTLSDSYDESVYVPVDLQRCSAKTLRWLADNTEIDMEAVLAYDSMNY